MLRRLNGRPQACDQCRSRKVACDHGQPVCGRCLKRGKAHECVYTISSPRKAIAKGAGGLRDVGSSGGSPDSLIDSAPRPATRYDPTGSQNISRQSLMTKRSRVQVTASPSIASQEASLFGASSDQAQTSHATHTSPQVDQDAIIFQSAASPAGQLPSGRASTPVGPGSGYLGFTSHSSLLEETKNSLSLLQGFQAWLPQLNENGNMDKDDLARLLCTPTREMCLVVLRGIPTPSMWQVNADSSTHPLEGWTRAACQEVLVSLHERFGHYLGPCRVDSQLLEIAHFLSENTTKPFSETEPDPKKWIGQFTGANLRWEGIGLLFTTSELPDSMPYLFSNAPEGVRTRIEWREVCRVCLGLCLDLSRRFSSANTLLAFLSFRRVIMESLFAGDASLSVWRGGAEAAALVTFLGMHTLPSTPLYKPNLASELRRRIFALIFTLDKGAVLFTGRPPCIGHRYATTPLPLDLKDEDLLEGGEVLERALDALDKNGWNTTGEMTRTTGLRARYTFAFIRDELIEIALGHGKIVRMETLLELRSRQLTAMSECPRSLIFHPGEISDPNLDVGTAYHKLLIHLDHLLNKFLVERLLMKHGETDNSDLLVASFHLVSTTLLFWTNKDRLASIRHDFEWLVLAYATPGGGILCMELLNPTFTGVHPKNPSITRSSIIQHLSLLIAFLEWVNPSGPNGALCASSAVIIKHVLDHILNAAAGNTWPPQELDDIQLDFNFELFDTFDWIRQDTLPSQL